jgi:hypothetical protein
MEHGRYCLLTYSKEGREGGEWDLCSSGSVAMQCLWRGHGGVTCGPPEPNATIQSRIDVTEGLRQRLRKSVQKTDYFKYVVTVLFLEKSVRYRDFLDKTDSFGGFFGGENHVFLRKRNTSLRTGLFNLPLFFFVIFLIYF